MDKPRVLSNFSEAAFVIARSMPTADRSPGRTTPPVLRRLDRSKAPPSIILIRGASTIVTTLMAFWAFSVGVGCSG